MSRRERRDGDLGVEELNIGAWGNPGSEWANPSTTRPSPRGAWADPMVDPPPGGPPTVPGPPSGPRPPGEDWSATTLGPGGGGPTPGERAGSWMRRHTNHVVAGAGAFALLIAVVAVASGPSGDPEAAPTTPPTTAALPTTEPRPVETAAPSTTEAPGRDTGTLGDGAADGADEVDYRFALGSTPDGFEVTGADLVDPGAVQDWMVPPGPRLFAADGTSWQSGPWLTISSGTDETGLPYMFPFIRPPMSYMIGDVEARTGTSVDSVELTSLRRGMNVVEIAARGLDPLATAAVAQAVQLTDDGIAIPDAAIPFGLRPRPDIDVTSWNWGWTPDTRAGVSYGSIDHDAWLSFSVQDRADNSSLLSSFSYVLTDVRYLIIGDGTGIAGTYQQPGGDPAQTAFWQTAGREYVATGTGVTLDELIGYAGQVVEPGDPQWRDRLWDDLREEADNCCRQGEETRTAPVWVPVASAEDATWRANATVHTGSLAWEFTLGGPNGDGFGLSSPLGAPVLRVGSRYGWAGAPVDFPAAALAIVDRSMAGAVLRLTTTGSQSQTVEVRLEPVDDDVLAPYLVGAAVLPWLDGGFVAQLVAPDGQTIAVQTDADLDF